MVDAVRRLAGPGASGDRLFAALRRFLHDAGVWSGHRPFAYDHADPSGTRIAGKILANYLATRRGNCVSMPALVVVLADRLGLDVAFATAPLHVFLRYRCERGDWINIEATSGGHPARDAWYRERMPMTDRAVESGLHLRTLSKREGVATLATIVTEHLIEQRRYHEALGVTQVILEHAPRDVAAMLGRAAAYGHLIRTEFHERYRHQGLIPSALRGRYHALCRRNHAMYQAAEALGREEPAA